jgi:hypothetical protein
MQAYTLTYIYIATYIDFFLIHISYPPHPISYNPINSNVDRHGVAHPRVVIARPAQRAAQDSRREIRLILHPYDTAIVQALQDQEGSRDWQYPVPGEHPPRGDRGPAGAEAQDKGEDGAILPRTQSASR